MTEGGNHRLTSVFNNARMHFTNSSKQVSSVSLNPNRFLTEIRETKLHCIVILTISWYTYFLRFVFRRSNTLSKAARPSCLRERNSFIQETSPFTKIARRELRCLHSASIGVFLAQVCSVFLPAPFHPTRKLE